MVNTNALTRDYCEERGWRLDMVERWDHYGRRSHDLYDCLDFLILDGSPSLLGIQVTTGANAAARRKKVIENLPRDWFTAGCRAEIWAWRRLAGQKVFSLRRDVITQAQLK